MNYIKICNNLADKLYTRGFGKRDKKCVKLSYEEVLYLIEREILKDFDFEGIFEEGAKKLKNFDVRFLAYRDLRNRGYIINVQDEYFEAKKNYSMKFYPISDMEYFEFEKEIHRELPHILIIVDGDGDVTYYLIEKEEPRGEEKRLPEKIRGKLIGERIMIFESPGSIENTTYGRYEGIFSHLSILEGKYLGERNVINLNLNSEDSQIYMVYKDLREHGLIVKSGFKYGTHFRVYEKNMEEHSRYLVHCLAEREEIQKISRAVRVSHGVRKELLFAKELKEKIEYLKVSWLRP